MINNRILLLPQSWVFKKQLSLPGRVWRQQCEPRSSGNTDVLRAWLQLFPSQMSHTKPYIRKKAVLIMYKVFLKYPESLRPAFPRLKEKLEDPDPGEWISVNSFCSHMWGSMCLWRKEFIKNAVIIFWALPPLSEVGEHRRVLMGVAMLKISSLKCPFLQPQSYWKCIGGLNLNGQSSLKFPDLLLTELGYWKYFSWFQGLVFWFCYYLCLFSKLQLLTCSGHS